MKNSTVNQRVMDYGFWSRLLLKSLFFLISINGNSYSEKIVPFDLIRIDSPLNDSLSGDYEVNKSGKLILPFGRSIDLLFVEEKDLNRIIRNSLEEMYHMETPIETYVIDKKMYVHVTGQVKEPGWISMNQYEDLFTALQKAGGLMDGAFIENIAIHREGKLIPCPLQVMMEEGKPSSNCFIKNADKIFIPRSPILGQINRTLMPYTPPPDESRDNIVNVLGEVAKPGAYEINTSVNILDMIAMAGGPMIPRNSAMVPNLESIKIIRKVDSVPEVKIFNLNEYFNSGNADLLVEVKAGDNILIPAKKVSVEDKSKMVTILGGVKNPGTYEISEEIGLEQMLGRAGGFKSFQQENLADKKNIWHFKYRDGKVFKTKIEWEKFLENPIQYPLPVVNANDFILVELLRSWQINEINLKQSVQVLGEVNKPGNYEINGKAELLEVLALAGGPKMETADPSITIIRIENGLVKKFVWNMDQFVNETGVEDCFAPEKCSLGVPHVMPGDKIFVMRKPEIKFAWWVEVLGGVATLGLFLFGTWNALEGK